MKNKILFFLSLFIFFGYSLSFAQKDVPADKHEKKKNAKAILFEESFETACRRLDEATRQGDMFNQ